MESPAKTQYRISTEKLCYKPRKLEGNWSNFFPSRHVTPSPTTYILKNVTCEARAGELTAVAGPSGAGKTTLLEILAGAVPMSQVTGHVSVNDRPMNPTHFRRLSGYVTQDEALFPLLTVEETLAFSARLRGPRSRATERVHALLKLLGLEHVAATRVGAGISGGEKRRVSIGVDLVHDPHVLFLDEPTSGLDSASAFHVAMLLKSMAMKQGKTIVLTIHQPGFRILQLFDQILLLSNGALVHCGSLGSLENRLGEAGYTIPRRVNVLEFAIEVTEALVENDTEEHCVQNIPSSDITRPILYTNPQWKEVLILSDRFSKNIWRTKQLFTARVVQSITVGLVLGSIFMKQPREHDPSRVIFQTHVGFFAFSLTFLLASTTEGLPIYLQERKILTRETSRGAYRVSSYVIANFLVFVPFLLIIAVLFSTPVYWLVGLRRDSGAFLYFSLVVYMVILMSNSFVACFSALVSDFISGTTLVAGVMGAFFLFSGYFIAEEDIPRYWVFVHYLSLFKYPFECFIVNEYGGPSGRGRCLASLAGECVLSGEEFLAQKGLSESREWVNLGVMLGFIVGYRFLCFLILWCRVHRNMYFF